LSVDISFEKIMQMEPERIKGLPCRLRNLVILSLCAVCEGSIKGVYSSHEVEQAQNKLDSLESKVGFAKKKHLERKYAL
jgi:hypothetical protein